MPWDSMIVKLLIMASALYLGYYLTKKIRRNLDPKSGCGTGKDSGCGCNQSRHKGHDS